MMAGPTYWRTPLAARPLASYCQSCRPLHCPCIRPHATAAARVSAGNEPPPLPEVERLSARVTRVLGRNPGPYSLTGTNLYLIGTGARRILVDAGEGKDGVLEDLLGVMTQEGCTGLDQIVITHWHHDHLMGVPELLRYFGPVPVRKYMPPEGTAKGEQSGMGFDPNHFLQGVAVARLADGEVLHCEGAALQVMFTPGHANDHVCLMLQEERGLFTGDNVLGWGTGTFSDLQTYMRSLRTMRDVQPSLLYPAHGPVVKQGEAGPWMQMYISHREERIQQVLAVLQRAGIGGLSPDGVAREVYADQPRVLKTPALFNGACNNSRLVLVYLEKEGQCTRDGDRYIFRAAKL